MKHIATNIPIHPRRDLTIHGGKRKFDEDIPRRHMVQLMGPETTDRKTHDSVEAHGILWKDYDLMPIPDRPAFYRTCRHGDEDYSPIPQQLSRSSF